MIGAKPHIIKLTTLQGDFYEGVSLAYDAKANRIRLYVLKSNADSLRGTTPEGTILEMSLKDVVVTGDIGRDDVVTYYENKAAENRHLQCTAKGADSFAYSDKYHANLKRAAFWREYNPQEPLPVYPRYDAEGNRIDEKDAA